MSVLRGIRRLLGGVNAPKAKHRYPVSSSTDTYYAGLNQDYRWFRQDELVRKCVVTNAYYATMHGFETVIEAEDPGKHGDVKQRVDEAQASWRTVCATALTHGIPVPAFTAALAYFDGYRSARLPANLLQAQRDYFGAHTYERIDRPRGEFFHTNWTGRGGATSASTYTV